jgi:RluA family pseudouridine synthase
MMQQTASILFEDDDVVAVSKPEGLASIPESSGGQASLLEQLAPAYPGKIFIVHRLDKDVSGVILFARHADAHRYLSRQFQERTAQKLYLAVVHGVVDSPTMTINLPLREFGSGRMGIDLRRGKASATEVQVHRQLPGYTLLKVSPLTGRRHQIRVHLYSTGHPIVGDRRYGDLPAQQGFPRLMLHALAVTLALPTGHTVTFEAPVPQSFQSVVDVLQGRRAIVPPP